MSGESLYNNGEVVVNNYEKEFIEHMQCCQTQRQILLLRKHRCDLIEKVHSIQKKIDCVDDI